MGRALVIGGKIISIGSAAVALPDLVDTTPPTISSLSPTDNATDVALSQVLTATFSEAVEFHTGGTLITRTGGSPVETFTMATATSATGDAGGTATINGAVLTITPGAARANSTGYAQQISASTIKDLAGNFFAGITDDTTWNFTTVDVPAPPGAVTYGWNENFDGGTTFDYIAAHDAAGGGNGTLGSPYTLDEALSAWRTAGTSKALGLRGGAYRQSMSTNGLEGTISCYSTERPRITAAEVVTGWTQCTSGDQADVGANYASIYKRTAFTNADAASGNIRAANLCENGRPMALAQDKPTGLFAEQRNFLLNDRNYHEDGTFVLSGSTIVGVDHAAVIGQYTDTQLARAFVGIHSAGNESHFKNITATNAAGGTITVPGGHSQITGQHWYSLINILPAMQAGEWGYIDHGDGTSTLYCWPLDTGNLTAGIEYSAREYVINYSSQQSGALTIRGLEIVQAAAGASSSPQVRGICLGTMTDVTNPATEGSATRRNQPLTVNNCYLGKTSQVGSDQSHGVVYINKTDDFTMTNCTLEHATNSYGYFINGDAPGGQVSDGARIENCLVRYIGCSASRNFGVRNQICAYNWFDACGYGNHPNQINYYIGSDNCLNFGLKTTRMRGFATWQQSSGIDWIMCDLGHSTDDRNPGGDTAAGNWRDQNGSGGGIVSTTKESYVLHCRGVPHKDHTTDTGKYSAFTLGNQSLPNMPWNMINCIVHGGGMYYAYDSTTPANRSPNTENRREYNVYTILTFWQKATYGWSLGTGEVSSTAVACYNGATAGDFSAKVGGPIYTTSGGNISSELAILQARYPGFDFERDMNGATVNWTAPGFVGPASDVTTLT